MNSKWPPRFTSLSQYSKEMISWISNLLWDFTLTDKQYLSPIVTGFNVWAAVFSVGIVCTFYTTMVWSALHYKSPSNHTDSAICMYACSKVCNVLCIPGWYEGCDVDWCLPDHNDGGRITRCLDPRSDRSWWIPEHLAEGQRWRPVVLSGVSTTSWHYFCLLCVWGSDSFSCLSTKWQCTLFADPQFMHILFVGVMMSELKVWMLMKETSPTGAQNLFPLFGFAPWFHVRLFKYFMVLFCIHVNLFNGWNLHRQYSQATEAVVK